jgi:anti-sigma B factor antagonist
MQVVEHAQALVVAVDPANCAGLWKLLEPALAAGGRTRVVLDFADVSFINSVNIAQVVALRQRLLPLGVELRVAGLRENIRAVFRILRLDKLFALDLDLGTALA